MHLVTPPPSPPHKVPPILGEVEARRTDWLAVGDVGAVEECEPGRFGSVAGESNMSSTMPRVRLRCKGMCPTCSSDLRAWKPWRPAGECRVAECQIHRAQQKQTISEQASEIAALRNRLNHRMADELVPFQAEVRKHQQDAEALSQNLRRAQIVAASHLKAQRLLETASIEQTHTIALLTEEVASLKMLLAERAREATLIQEQAAVEVKRHARAERQWAHPAKQIAELSAKAKAQLAEAEAQRAELVAEAEARCAELTAKAEAQLTEALADVERAHEDALRAREEAVAEAQLEREAQAASHAHEMKLLDKRLQRAERRATKVVAEEYRPTERSPEEWAALSCEAERTACSAFRVHLACCGGGICT